MFAAPCLAQATGGGAAPAPANNGTPYWAAVNANNVFVRSSPSVQSSYPFGRLAAGDVVQVLEESYGWARVRCTGPAFDSIFGFVPADRRVELSSDGTTLKVTAKSEVKAPNVGSKESPDASWKPIAKLAAGDVLAVVGTMEGEREKVFKVVLPDSAEGFVNLNYLRRASAAEVDAARERRSAAATSTPAPAPAPAAVKPRAAVKPEATAKAAGAADEVVAVEVEGAVIDTPEGEVVAERVEVVTKPRQNDEPPISRAAQEATANRVEFEDLESIWNTVKLQPLENAELSVLRGRYAELVTRPNVASDVRQMSKARVEQLTLKLEVQERIYTLERLKAQRGQDLDRMHAISLAMEARSDYDAVGVLNASTVFDGKRLPALYRLQDPAVGQTVAYVVPRDDFQLATMLGVLVGIKGQKRYDEPLRLTVIEPRSVDILTQRRDPQFVMPGSTPTAPSATPSTGTSQPASVSSSAAPQEPVYYAPVPPDAR